MCGIAGIVRAPDAPPPSVSTMAALAHALRHRGPDGIGQVSLGGTALVQTRLAIVDVAGGNQPLFAGAAALIANGEIYNDPDLRRDLEGAPFVTGSDCESPLFLWQRDGDSFAKGLRGMFAIAINDPSSRSLLLARDPFGIKPLYTAPVPGGIAFASEPRALLEAGLARRDVRTGALHELLQMQFTTGARTIFSDITRVLPGETLRVAGGHVVERQRNAVLPESGPETIDEQAALKRLDAALMNSVAAHQRSDVPYGMFLSGGIDSSAVLACMARLNDRPVRAFTAGFDVPGAPDERAHAAAVARAVGADHETIDITKDMVFRNLPDIVACMDDPAADYAIIPTWFLARRARKDVKVVLSGEGGDEIFGGYGRYRSAVRPWFLGGRLMRGRGNFGRLDVLRAPLTGWRDGLAASELRAATQGRSRLQAHQATDISEWLANDLLIKLDRCLMAHAIEGRTPFLDPSIAAAGFRLPDTLKIRDGRGKYLLRQWLAAALPEARPFAPKQGFTVPVGSWIAAEGDRLGRLVAAQPGVAEIAEPSKVVGLFRNASNRREGFAAWTLLFYALWHRAHIEARPTGPDTYEYLA